MNDYDFKEMALDKIEKAMTEIKEAYLQVYDEKTRDEVFIKEMADMILPINTLMYVYTRDGNIHPNYCLEKLKHLQSMVDTHIRYWKSKEIK